MDRFVGVPESEFIKMVELFSDREMDTKKMQKEIIVSLIRTVCELQIEVERLKIQVNGRFEPISTE